MILFCRMAGEITVSLASFVTGLKVYLPVRVQSPMKGDEQPPIPPLGYGTLQLDGWASAPTQLNSTENYGRRCLTPLSPHRNYIILS